MTVDGKLGQPGGAPPGPEARNLDHFALAVRPFDEAAIRDHLAAHGVQATGLYRLRFVTHLGVDAAGVDHAAQAIRRFFGA